MKIGKDEMRLSDVAAFTAFVLSVLVFVMILVKSEKEKSFSEASDKVSESEVNVVSGGDALAVEAETQECVGKITLGNGMEVYQPSNYASSVSWPLMIVVGKAELPSCPGAFLLKIAESSKVKSCLDILYGMGYNLDNDRVVMVADEENFSAVVRFASLLSAGMIVCNSPETDNHDGKENNAENIFEKWKNYDSDWRPFLGNISRLPIVILAGSDSTGLAHPPKSARRMAKILDSCREEGLTNYWETPMVLTPEMIGQALLYCTGNVRSEIPKKISWTAGINGCSEAWWIALGQPMKGLKISSVIAVAEDRNHVKMTTENLVSFTLKRNPLLFDNRLPLFLTIDGEKVIVPPAGKEEREHTVAFRYESGKGWNLEKYNHAPKKYKNIADRGNLGTSISGNAVIVVGSTSEKMKMNDAWSTLASKIKAEADEHPNDIRMTILKDSDVTLDALNDTNILLLGGTEDNVISELLRAELPLNQLFGQVRASVDVDSQNFGYAISYPLAKNKKILMLGANSPETTEKLEFCINFMKTSGNMAASWLNDGILEVADYVVMDDARICAGIFGPDWSIEKGTFFCIPAESKTGNHQ